MSLTGNNSQRWEKLHRQREALLRLVVRSSLQVNRSDVTMKFEHNVKRCLAAITTSRGRAHLPKISQLTPGAGIAVSPPVDITDRINTTRNSDLNNRNVLPAISLPSDQSTAGNLLPKVRSMPHIDDESNPPNGERRFNVSDILKVVIATTNSRQSSFVANKIPKVAKIIEFESLITSRVNFQRRSKEKERLLKKFRRAARLIMVLCGLWKEHSRRVKHFLDTNVDMIEFHNPIDLLFDVTAFRIDQQTILSHETRRILLTKPMDRTQDDVKHLVIALRNYPSIAAYPISMAKAIAEQATYLKVANRRVILKEGHVARTFYFILSGSVVITKMDMETGTSRTVCFLNRNESFGDLGLINKQPRQASVVSREVTELLVLLEEDFTEIFMAGGMKDGGETFLRQLWIFKQWPLENLKQYPQEAFLSYFKRKTVLVMDSQHSDWLYIIKSGSCSVLKRLSKVAAKHNEAKYNKDEMSIHNRHDNRGILERKKELRGLDLRVKLIPIEETYRQEMEQAGYTLNVKGHHYKKIPEIRIIPVTPSSQFSNTSNDFSEEEPDENSETSTDDNETRQEEVPQLLQPMSKGSHPQKKDHRPPFPSQTLANDYDDDYDLEMDEDGLHTNYVTVHDIQTYDWHKRRLSTIRSTSARSEGSSSTDISVAVSMTEELNKAFLHENRVLTPSHLYPEFVQVDNLTKGSIFGIQTCVHEDQPQLSLVSNGAECIVISKRLFLQYASDDLLNQIRVKICPYPSNDELQESLETYDDWVKYKNIRLQSALKWNKFAQKQP